MAKQRNATEPQTTLRGLTGGKSRVRTAYEACRDTTTVVLELSVITVPSAGDEAYAAQVARLLAAKA